MRSLHSRQKSLFGLAIAAPLAGVLASIAWAAAPELTITSPANGSKVTTAKVHVTGTYSGFTGDHCSIDGSNDCTLFASGGETHFKGAAILKTGRNEVTVAVFGSGENIFRSVTVTYRPPPAPIRKHHRRITFAGGANPQGQVFWNGKLFVAGGFAPCGKKQPIQIQRLFGSRWKTVAKTRTGALTRLGANFGIYLARHAGERYRALAPETRSGNDICLPVSSKAVKTF
jgi:Glucodextranase, domain B